MLDFTTLFVVTMFITVVGGLLLLFAWRQNPAFVALGLWGSAYLMASVAMAMLAAHGPEPDFRMALFTDGLWTTLPANALWITAHGVMWTAARSFEGRRTPLVWTLAGLMLWAVACQFEGFLTSLPVRMMLSSTITGVYLLLCASEIWRARDRELMSRWPAIVLLIVHGSMFLGRVPFIESLPFPGGILAPAPGWFPIGVFAILFHNFSMSVLLVNMAKERAELLQRQTSLVDPLTGVANRRAFFDRAEALLRRASADGLACALLVFDLDRFKAVNDTYGHQAGDRVLAKFCDVARAILRPQDPFGRFGGEEFACLLVDVSLGDALRTADRVRTAFATAPFALGLSKAGVTVSVGIAMSGETEQNLQTLFASADRSLYSAKAKGRNRVEAARKPLQVIEGAGVAAI